MTLSSLGMKLISNLGTLLSLEKKLCNLSTARGMKLNLGRDSETRVGQDFEV